MPSSPQGDGQRGSVTVEFAVALPAVVVVLGIVLGCGVAAAEQIRVAEATAAAARALSRGELESQATAMASRVLPAVRLRVQGDDEVVCVTGSGEADAPLLGGIPLEAVVCVPDGGR